ncbi:hypothetical protein V1517DRAFT_105613 [Lipomyces orientalis]|uniref:Uncharacterized protein n=1 Tax=Lipomyces orientalis TaxID=1233043 RepID=A0ACC3TQ95_9ASCO
MRVADTDVPKFVLVPKQTELEVFYHNPLHRELAALVQYRIKFVDELPPTQAEIRPLTADNIVHHQIFDSYSDSPIGDYALQQELFVPSLAATQVAAGDTSIAARFFHPKPIPYGLGKITLYNPTTTHSVSTMLNPRLSHHPADLYDSLRAHGSPAGFAFTYALPASAGTKKYSFVWNDIDVSTSFGGGPASMSGKCNFVDPASSTSRMAVAKLYIYNLDGLLRPGRAPSPSTSDDRINEIVLIEDNIRLLDVNIDRKGFEASLLLSVFMIASAHECARGLASREKRRKRETEAAERAERDRARAQAEAEARDKRERDKAGAKARNELRKNEELTRRLQEKEQARAEKDRLRMERNSEKYAKMLVAREDAARRKDEELARKLQEKEEQELARIRRSDEEFARKLQMEEERNSPTRRYGMKVPKLRRRLAHAT